MSRLLPSASGYQLPTAGWSAVVALICFAAACDQADDGVYAAGVADASGQRAGDRSTDQIDEPTFEVGPSLLDHATCEVGKVTVAACGASDARLRSCDHAWMSRCNEIGGDALACESTSPRLTEFLSRPIDCSATMPLQRPCDTAFKDACRDHGTTFVAFSTDVPRGQCVTPEDCKAEAVCPGGGTVGCTVSGNGACSSQDGVGGFATCITIKANGDRQQSGAFCGS